jgi:hypothetical protein
MWKLVFNGHDSTFLFPTNGQTYYHSVEILMHNLLMLLIPPRQENKTQEQPQFEKKKIHQAP